MINIEINYQIKVPQRFETLFKRIAKVAFHKFKLRNDFTVSVALVSSQKIKFLNKKYRGKDVVTDVLSFPQINEIIISYPKAVSQARAKNNSLRKEFSWLFCHGLLHLLGLSHQFKKDERVMRSREKEILEAI